jgi:hypothetical protein
MLQTGMCGANPLQCLTNKVLGVPSLDSLYQSWLHSRGVDANSDSTYASGQIAGLILSLAAGGALGAEPTNLKEQLAMEQAQSNPAAGRVITRITMSDPHWLAEEGWVKMQQNVNGVVIHYVYNPLMDAVDDYKFVP